VPGSFLSVPFVATVLALTIKSRAVTNFQSIITNTLSGLFSSFLERGLFIITPSFLS
jgi:hypothetical protein